MDIDERQTEHIESSQTGGNRQQSGFAPVRRKMTDIGHFSMTPITHTKSLKPLDITYLNNNGGLTGSNRPLDKDSVKG